MVLWLQFGMTGLYSSSSSDESSSFTQRTLNVIIVGCISTSVIVVHSRKYCNLEASELAVKGWLALLDGSFVVDGLPFPSCAIVAGDVVADDFFPDDFFVDDVGVDADAEDVGAFAGDFFAGDVVDFFVDDFGADADDFFPGDFISDDVGADDGTTGVLMGW